MAPVAISVAIQRFYFIKTKLSGHENPDLLPPVKKVLALNLRESGEPSSSILK